MASLEKNSKWCVNTLHVLKKQILNRNPRKECVGFERKMNVDGSYWKPEQYPKTTWVAAKGPSVDPVSASSTTPSWFWSIDDKPG